MMIFLTQLIIRWTHNRSTIELLKTIKIDNVKSKRRLEDLSMIDRTDYA